MEAKQLSIFLENKTGRLTEVTQVLAREGINLSALCIAENADLYTALILPHPITPTLNLSITPSPSARICVLP